MKKADFCSSIVIVLFFLGACGDSRVLSGSFRSDTFVYLGDTAQAEVEDLSKITPYWELSNLSLELVLAHFGPEVAGLAKFRRVFGLGQCPCVPVRNGRFSGNIFTFNLSSVEFTNQCLSSPLGKIDFRATLKLREGGILDGLEEGFLEVGGERFGIMLGRDRQWEDLSRQDLSCEGFWGSN